MWWFIQILIIFAVVSSNIAWHWTPNGYVAAMIGGFAALVVTVTLSGLFDLLRQRRRR